MWPDGKIIFQYLPNTYNKIAKVGSKWREILSNPQKYSKTNFAKSGHTESELYISWTVFYEVCLLHNFYEGRNVLSVLSQVT